MSRNNKNNTSTISDEKIVQNTTPTGKVDSFGGLSKDELMNALRLMFISRQVDNKLMNLIRQGKSFFHIAAGGHEAVQVALGLVIQKGVDWGFPYYRDMAFMLAMGIKPEDLFLHMLSKNDDPMTGGRQMPCHWGSRELNIPTQSSPTGTQFLQAVGTALANKKMGLNSVTYVSSGEGTTSQGEFFEAVNWASREKIPVVFCIQNNKYAISVPVEDQSAGKNASISEMMKGFDNLFRQTVDGTDFLASHAAAKSAFKYARQGKGPALIEASVVRLFSHSSSDDQKKYRPLETIEDDLKRDPITKFSEYLIKKNVLTQLAYTEFKKEIKNHVDEAADWAVKQPAPSAENAIRYVLDESGKKDRLEYEKESGKGKPVVLVDAVNHALREELETE